MKAVRAFFRRRMSTCCRRMWLSSASLQLPLRSNEEHLGLPLCSLQFCECIYRRAHHAQAYVLYSARALWRAPPVRVVARQKDLLAAEVRAERVVVAHQARPQHLNLHVHRDAMAQVMAAKQQHLSPRSLPGSWERNRRPIWTCIKRTDLCVNRRGLCTCVQSSMGRDMAGVPVRKRTRAQPRHATSRSKKYCVRLVALHHEGA